MMPGSEKILLSLGVKAERQSDVPLNMSDVKVLDISVASSRNSHRYQNGSCGNAKENGQASPVRDER
ncbi:hypothetical protein Barb6XT_01182 [Bacteroidales bacterium Barb6XT]|nr:hypothetical protein Barb6XT_01182 [Bacteroidales bacterium Barb6XT]